MSAYCRIGESWFWAGSDGVLDRIIVTKSFHNKTKDEEVYIYKNCVRLFIHKKFQQNILIHTASKKIYFYTRRVTMQNDGCYLELKEGVDTKDGNG